MDKDMELTDEEVQMLAKAERDIDNGKVQYVVNKSARIPVPGTTMDQLGLESGQNISDLILIEILKRNLSNIKAIMVIEEARKKD